MSDESDPIICFCYNVRKRQILDAIADGTSSLAEIQVRLGASTGCGGCEMDIREILEQAAKPPKKE